MASFEIKDEKDIRAELNKARCWDLGCMRHPWYMIRGKSITREQVKYILKSEFPMFTDWESFQQDRFSEIVPLPFDEIIPCKSSFFGAGGWLRSSGEIGGNTWIDGMPYPDEEWLLAPWINLAVKFPFLDLAVGFTMYDRLPCSECPLKDWYRYREWEYWTEWEYAKRRFQAAERVMQEKDIRVFPCEMHQIEECREHFKNYRFIQNEKVRDNKMLEFDSNYEWYVDVPQIAESVRVTVQLQDGICTIHTGEDACIIYREYNRKYCFENPHRYSVKWNQLTGEPVITEQMLRECFCEVGIDAEKAMEFLEKKKGRGKRFDERGAWMSVYEVNDWRKIPKGLQEAWLEIACVKRPWYMVRGKSITPEQVKQILKESFPMFGDWENFQSDRFPRLVPDPFGAIIPHQSFCLGASGWMRSSGELGGNSWSGYKYPEVDEFLPPWIDLAGHYPFLDLVVGITTYNEFPCWMCPVKELYVHCDWQERNYEDKWYMEYGKQQYEAAEKALREKQVEKFPCKMNKISECREHFRHYQKHRVVKERTEEERIAQFNSEYECYVDVPEVADSVQISIQIQNGICNIYTGEDAREVYRKYNSQYCFENTYRYSLYWNYLTGEPMITEQMLRECFDEIGVDSEKAMEFLKKDLIDSRYL